MKIKLTILLLLAAVTVFGQDYPVNIPAGHSLTVTAGNRDLWVITDSQMDSAVATGLKVRTCDSINSLYRLKISKLQSINSDLQAVNDTLQKGYLHYVDLWKTCDRDLENKRLQLNRQKKMKYIFGGSGLIAGFLVAVLLL